MTASPSLPATGAGSYGFDRAIVELQGMFAAQWSNGMLPHIRFVPGNRTYRPDPTDWGVTPEISGQNRAATSGITQPPIMGLCAYEVFSRLPRPVQHLDTFLALAAGIERFHGFLLSARDPAGDGLAACVHPWETGMDNSPAFESLMERTREYVRREGVSLAAFARADRQHVPAEHRPKDSDYVAFFGLIDLFKSCGYDEGCIARKSPFLWQDVLFNTLLVVSLDALARLEEDLAGLLEARSGAQEQAPRDGEPARLRQQAATNRVTAGRVAAAIRDRLWSEQDGLFYPRDLREGRLVRVATVSSLLPLLAGIATPGQAARLIAHLRDPGKFATAFPVPSTALDEPAFDPLRYWAGPSWPVPNWLLVRALAALEPELGARLRTRTLAMIAETEGDPGQYAERARQVIEGNSVEGGATTPSRRQYQHAWLWDSAIAALGWTYIDTRPELLPADSPGPNFWEYYHPLTGAPLGAPRMTWTAAVYLDLLLNERILRNVRRP